MADDYGVEEVGCYGADNYKTPNIDKLVNTGIKFNHCYTTSLCGPSKALLLTGRYAFRTGVVNQDKTGEFTPKTETVIPETLKKQAMFQLQSGNGGNCH